MRIVVIFRKLIMDVRCMWCVCLFNLLVYILVYHIQILNILQTRIGSTNSTLTLNSSQYVQFNPNKVPGIVRGISFANISKSRENSLRFVSDIVTDNLNKAKSSPSYYLTHFFRHHSNKYYTSRILNRLVAEKSLAFSQAISSKERRVLQDILLKCQSELDRAGITYFIYSGTLLGSYRHHDIIPWDDDVDIIVNFKQRQSLFSTLNHLKPFFSLDVHMDVRWKFYSIQSRPIKTLPWSWPFIDISFYHENSTHIWDSDVSFSKYYLYEKSDVFPLRQRPFMGMLLPAPRNTGVILKFYKTEICRSGSYNHRKEREVKHVYNVNCLLLDNRYPMIQRQMLANGINETLVIRGKILSWYFALN